MGGAGINSEGASNTRECTAPTKGGRDFGTNQVGRVKGTNVKNTSSQCVQVVEISKMQGIITQNIVQQAELMENIYATCEEAVENIAAGNEQILQTEKRLSSGTWNMFLFLMICTMCMNLFHILN